MTVMRGRAADYRVQRHAIDSSALDSCWGMVSVQELVEEEEERNEAEEGKKRLGSGKGLKRKRSRSNT